MNVTNQLKKLTNYANNVGMIYTRKPRAHNDSRGRYSLQVNPTFGKIERRLDNMPKWGDVSLRGMWR